MSWVRTFAEINLGDFFYDDGFPVILYLKVDQKEAFSFFEKKIISIPENGRVFKVKIHLDDDSEG